MKATWEHEKQDVERVRKLREELEDVNNQIQVAQREYNLEKAAELQYGKLPQIKQELETGVPSEREIQQYFQIPERGFKEFKQLTKRYNSTISKLMAMDSTRQEFVSNVSHELKTPITSMKVLADSLIQNEVQRIHDGHCG